MTDSTLTARRPRVICHMMSSLDGRIVTDGWPQAGWWTALRGSQRRTS
ncbi:hypothetical protein [Longimicrobium sp.]